MPKPTLILVLLNISYWAYPDTYSCRKYEEYFKKAQNERITSQQHLKQVSDSILALRKNRLTFEKIKKASKKDKAEHQSAQIRLAGIRAHILYLVDEYSNAKRAHRFAQNLSQSTKQKLNACRDKREAHLKVLAKRGFSIANLPIWKIPLRPKEQ